MRKQEEVACENQSLASVESDTSVCFCWLNTVSCLKSSLTGECLADLYSPSVPTHVSACSKKTHSPVDRKQQQQQPKRSLDMLVTREPLSTHYGGLQQYHLNQNRDIIGGKMTGMLHPLSQVDVIEALKDEGNYNSVTSPRHSSSMGLNDPCFESDIAYHPFVETSIDPGYGSNGLGGGGSTSCSSSSSFASSSSNSSSEDDGGETPSSIPQSALSLHGVNTPIDGSICLDVDYLKKVFPFIAEGTVFTVTLFKSNRGLGLSLTGGLECEDMAFPGLIRVKKLYPDTPAWLCGCLKANDFILEANGIQLTGLTSHGALEVLRTSVCVELKVCRVPQGALTDLVECSEVDCGTEGSTKESTYDSTYNQFLAPSSSLSTCGDFEIQLTKVGGSLGFTLKKNDNSILGHTIRSLVRDPALSDGRIRPGDKLLSVNGTDMCGLSHEQAVKFLRTCPETVVIRIYRDAIQTPVSPASPTEPDDVMPKSLRREARDFLSLLAFQKRDSASSQDCSNEQTSTIRRRKLKNASPHTKTEGWDNLVREAQKDSSDILLYTEEGCAISSIDCPIVSYTEEANISNSFRHSRLVSPSSHSDSQYLDHKPLKRPNFLDLTSSYCSRKSSFTPPDHHQCLPYQELENLSSTSPCSPARSSFSTPIPMESTDSFGSSTTTVQMSSIPNLVSAESDHFYSTAPSGPRSLNEPYLFASEDTDRPVITSAASTNNLSGLLNDEIDATSATLNGLLKWKDVVFTPDDDTSSDDEFYRSDNSQIISISLSRGWNSRLGFSLNDMDGQTVVMAIYPESVAAKNGRLSVGDVIMEVNGLDVTSLDCDCVKEEIRKTSGMINLKVFRNAY